MEFDKKEFDKKVAESKQLFPQRLQLAMDLNNIKAVELAKKTGITKSKISSYLSGRFRAKQDGIFTLATALNVNPVWLMGLDVPMNDTNVFPYKIQDNEMAVLLDVGDIAIIDKNYSFDTNKTYLLKYKGKTIIRKIIQNENTIILQPFNSQYPTITTTKEEIEIIGKVIKAENESAFR